MLDELGVVEDVSVDKLLFHLVELKCTDGIEVASLELLLQNSWVDELIGEFSHAPDIVSNGSSILSVLKVSWADLLLQSSIGLLLLGVLDFVDLLEDISGVSS